MENATQARALADAIRCRGRTFNVSWEGNVVVNGTILIADGTAVNVIGVGVDAVIDGDGVTCLFAVMNASLR